MYFVCKEYLLQLYFSKIYFKERPNGNHGNHLNEIFYPEFAEELRQKLHQNIDIHRRTQLFAQTHITKRCIIRKLALAETCLQKLNKYHMHDYIVIRSNDKSRLLNVMLSNIRNQ